MVDTKTKQKYEMKEEQLQRSIFNMMMEKERKDKLTKLILIDHRSVLIDDVQLMSTDSFQNLHDKDILMVDNDHDDNNDHNDDVPVTKK